MHKGSTNDTHVHDVQTNINKGNLETHHIQTHAMNNTKNARGQVTFNVSNLSTSYRKEAHWI